MFKITAGFPTNEYVTEWNWTEIGIFPPNSGDDSTCGFGCLHNDNIQKTYTS